MSNKRFTIYINEMPSKSFNLEMDAEDFTRSLPDNTDFTVWDNEFDCEYSFFEEDVLFNDTKKIDDVTKKLVIYRYKDKIKALYTDSSNESKVTYRSFMFTKTFTTYRQLVEKAKKHFGFAEK